MAQPHIVLHNTMGVMFTGVVVAATLYGVTCVQTWFYFTRYQKDPWYIKTLVIAVWTFDTLHQILITHCIYMYLVTYYGQSSQLRNIIWSLVLEVLVNGCTAFVVQSFLAYRLWKLSNKNIILATCVAALVLGEFVIVIVYTVMTFGLQTFVELERVKGLSMSINAVGAAGDVLISLVLCTILHRSRTGFKRSDSIIRRLMLFTINTGLLTSLCAVASLISIIAAPDTFIYICFFFTLGRLYSNSLMAVLNARRSISGTSRDDNATLSLQGIPGVTMTKPDSGSAKSYRPPNNIDIKIDTTQEFVRDPASSASDVSHSPLDV